MRTDRPDGSKTFRWELPDGTRGLRGRPQASLPLYGLGRLSLAAGDAPVYLAEGEKAADALTRLGLIALATVTGALGTPDDEVLSVLAGRDVRLWPDNDDVGRAHMERIDARLVDLEIAVSIVAWAEAPEHGDAADFVAAGLGASDVLALPVMGEQATPEPRIGLVSPISLGDALASIEQFLLKYVVFARPEAVVAVVLWIAHTHAIEHAEATPYLGISSPVKQSGKTRLLECLMYLSRGASGIMIAPTASTIFRGLEANPGATLLLDELDAVFSDRSDRYEETRAVINAGHRRSATVPRSVPGPKNTWVVKQFPVFGPKALAGIGKLPDTISDRSIPIRMQKRLRSEPIKRFRERAVRAEAAPLVAGLIGALDGSPPAYDAAVPEALPDRAADAWEPLLAIADAAGGPWPARGRQAAIVLHAHRADDDSLGLRLLSDVRLVFDRLRVDRISTADLVEALRADEEGPWAGEPKPLSPHRLGRLLAPFEIGPKQLRVDGRSLKGYEQSGFVDAWARYLAPDQTPLEAKHRNTDQERSFDVSVPRPSDEDWDSDPAILRVEDDYPRSAWDPHWLGSPEPVPLA